MTTFYPSNLEGKFHPDRMHTPHLNSLLVSGCSIKENEEVFLDIKDIYEGRVFDEDVIDDLDDITVNERKSPTRKVEKKEKEDKIDIESLTDEEWAKYLGL